MSDKRLAAVAVLCAALVGLQAASQPESRAILVTLPKAGEPVAAPEFEVRVGNQRAEVLRVQSPAESHLRLALLIDDGAGPTLVNNLRELKGFIDGLPADSLVLVAYRHGGALKIEQPFTADLAAAGAALTVPARTNAGGDLGGSIAELLEQFPDGFAERGQVLYLGEGTGFVGEAHHDPTLARAIRRAQERGVVIWSLHVGSTEQAAVIPGVPQTMGLSDHLDQEAYLERLSRETGGQALALGLHPPSLQPYLQQLRAFFDRQYRVEFQPPPGTAGKKLIVKLSGGRQSVLHSER